jgi:hypothetical protein
MADEPGWCCRTCIGYDLKAGVCRQYFDSKHAPEDACYNWHGINGDGEVVSKWGLKKHKHDVIDDHATQDVVKMERGPAEEGPLVAARPEEPKPKPADVPIKAEKPKKAERPKVPAAKPAERHTQMTLGG